MIRNRNGLVNGSLEEGLKSDFTGLHVQTDGLDFDRNQRTCHLLDPTERSKVTGRGCLL